MRANGALGNILPVLTTQPPCELDVAYFRGVLAKGLESGTLAVEPHLQDAILRLLDVGADRRESIIRVQETVRAANTSVFGGIFA